MGHFGAAKQVVLWESLWITSSKGRAVIPVYRQGTVKLMAMTDGSVVLSSRTRTMRELLCQGSLPTLHKPGHEGQQQTCQSVTQCSSGPARLTERDGGTCVVPVAPWWGKAAFLAAQMAPDGSSRIAPVGIARAFLETSSVKACCVARGVVLHCATTWQHL